jgi:VanZ family protein
VEPRTLAWRRVVPWGPVVAWTALIFVLSSRSRVPGLEGLPDVLTHGVGYLVLCFLITRAASLGWPLGGWPGPLAVVLSTLYGVSDELHQAFVPGRHADLWDVVKDALGAVLGALAYRWFAGRQDADGRSR